MHRVFRWAGPVALVAALAAARADDPKPPRHLPKSAAEQYEAINKEMTAAHEKFLREHRAAQTDEDREKLIQRNVDGNAAFAQKMVSVAEESPKDPANVQTLMAAFGMSPLGPVKQKAL